MNTREQRREHRTRLAALAMTGAACCMMAAHAADLRAPSLNPVRFHDAPAVSAVTLVKDGAAAASIVIAEDELKQKKGIAYRAAQEFAAHVKLATGADLPLVADTADVAGAVVLVGESRLTREKGIAAADLPPEGFCVRSFDGGLAIVGRAPDAGGFGAEGTLWGVFDVLERFLGIRWYHPRADGRIVPQTADVAVPPVHYTDHPDRIMRIMGGAPVQYRPGKSSPVGIACHTPTRFGIHFKEAPECFEMDVDGSRNGGMPCYGNPKTVELMIRDLEAFYSEGNKDPWRHPSSTNTLWGPPTDKVYYISPPDKGVDCHCEFCRKLVDTTGPRLGRASRIVGRFTARMAGEIKKRWPHLTVHYLPYANYTLPPGDVVFPDNVIVSLCMMSGAANDKEPAIAADNDRMIEGWSKLTGGRPIRLWEYVCWPVDDTALPFQYPHVVKGFHQRHRQRVEGSFLNTGYYPPEIPAQDAMWACQTPALYCWFRTLWNPGFNVDAALAEYVDLMYGPARAPMGAILDLLTDRWERTRWKDPIEGHHVSPFQIHEETMPRAEALRLKALLAESRSLAAEGTVFRRRVDFFGMAIEAFLKESDSYHEGGKNLPALKALKVGGNPVVDGVLDDACWRDVEPQFFKMGFDKVNTVPTNSTTVQAVWTDSGITFAFRLTEPAVDKIRKGRTQRDQDIYADDCIELFLDVEGQRKRACQVVANAIGTLYDRAADGTEWNAAGAKAAAHIGKDFWSLEVFLPFADFPEKPKVAVGSKWYANFTRSRYVGGWELQRWSTLYRAGNRDFHAFGEVRFVE